MSSSSKILFLMRVAVRLVFAGAFFFRDLVLVMAFRNLRSKLFSCFKNVSLLLMEKFPGEFIWRRRNLPASAASGGVFISVLL